MARSLVQALEGISFPCNRSGVIEYAKRNDISPRAMDFLERLPDQQYASMGELFAVLPSKGSLRKSQSRPQEPGVPPQEALAQEDAEAETQRDQPASPVEAADVETEFEGEDGDEAEEAEPMPVPQAVQDRRNEPNRAPSGNAGRGARQPDLAAMTARMDPFGVAGQWQRLWLDWYGKSAESYTRLFMPWRRR